MDSILYAIAEERKKQIQNGLYLIHDRNKNCETMISDLASFYASNNNVNSFNMEDEYSKKSKLTRKEQLITAAALIVAELQRLEQLEYELYCFVKYL
jgi:hypothetical protein